jgi:hypothetical protein
MTKSKTGALHSDAVIIANIKRLAQNRNHDGCGCSLQTEILTYLQNEGY